MPDLDRPLGDVFAARDLEDFNTKATADLKGRPLERLTKTNADGVEIRPLYTRGDAVEPTMIGLPGAPPFRRGTRPLGRTVAGLDVRAVIETAAPKLAVQQLHEALGSGATSVLLRIAAPTATLRSSGVRLASTDAMLELLEGVDAAAAAVHVDAGSRDFEFGRAWAAALETRGLHPAAVHGGLGLNPLANLARDGVSNAGIEAQLSVAAELAREFSLYPHLRIFSADAGFVHHAGASTAQSLGATLGLAVTYLRAMVNAGIDVESACARITFSLRLDCRFFEQIAALRALRITWNRIAEASGTTASAMQVHALASERVVARRDRWVNMLRGTATSFAALIGGADAVTAPAFDRACTVSTELGQRIARNTPIVLAEEAHLHRVVDPAGGSWFLENLTAQIALKAWEQFQLIESDGGMLESLRNGRLRERVDATCESRRTELARRRQAITGVSEFPQLDETIPGDAPSAPADEKSQPEAEPVDAWPLRRDADDFEQLRDAADALALGGKKPRAFLATLGPVAAHVTRATWVRNLLAVGGIEAVEAGAFESAMAVGAAARSAAAPIAVICSSDEVYAEHAVSAAMALREAGATTIWLAGKAGEDQAALRAAGVDRFVHLGVDVVELLREALTQCGDFDLEGGPQ